MSAYEPPTADYPIFDSLAFQTPNSASITLAEADVRYLARNNIATSNASLTSFAGDITIGNSKLDYTSGTGLAINGTANGESIYANVLNSGGVTKAKFDLHPSHIHLYDAVRITDSSALSNYTLLQQTTTTMNIDNQIAGSVINLKTKTGGNVAVTNLTLTSSEITANVPITLGYTVAPIISQIGYNVPYTTNALVPAAASGVTKECGNVTLSAGTWIITFSSGFLFTSAGTLTRQNIEISTASAVIVGNNSYQQNFPRYTAVLNGDAFQQQVQLIVSSTVSFTRYFNLNYTYTGTANVQGSYGYIRIA